MQTVRHAGKSTESREQKTFRGSDDDLRAMKRALAHAQLGPKATMALTSAIIALEEDVEALERELRAQARAASDRES